MKTFLVSCNCTQHFRIPVKATTEEEAFQKVENILAEESVPDNADVFDREYDAVQADEVSND